MLRGDWYKNPYLGLILAAALLGLIVSFFLYSDASRSERIYQQQAEHRAQYYVERANVAGEQTCARLTAREKADCIRNERDAARQGERESYDLQAQLVTSVWTRNMAITAMFGMIVGIVGIGLVAATFRETRNAAEAARNTYDAFIALEGAKIYVTGCTITSRLQRVSVRLNIRNQGRSDAVIRLINWELTDASDYPETLSNSLPTHHFVGSGTAGDTERFQADDWGPSVKHLFGYIVYDSVLQEGRETYFCLRLTPEGEARQKVSGLSHVGEICTATGMPADK